MTHAETAGSHNPRLTGRGTRSSPRFGPMWEPAREPDRDGRRPPLPDDRLPGRDIRLWPVDSEGPKRDPRIVDIPDTEGEPMIERSDCEA